MVFEQFPEDELIRINTNVFIQKSRYNGEYQLWFTINNRYFQIGIPVDDEESARWHAKMFCSALEEYVLLP